MERAVLVLTLVSSCGSTPPVPRMSEPSAPAPESSPLERACRAFIGDRSDLLATCTEATKQFATVAQAEECLALPPLYQFSYMSDGSLMSITAVGDMDCDKTFVRYRIDGSIEDTGVVFKSTYAPRGID